MSEHCLIASIEYSSHMQCRAEEKDRAEQNLFSLLMLTRDSLRDSLRGPSHRRARLRYMLCRRHCALYFVSHIFLIPETNFEPLMDSQRRGRFSDCDQTWYKLLIFIVTANPLADYHQSCRQVLGVRQLSRLLHWYSGIVHHSLLVTTQLHWKYQNLLNSINLQSRALDVGSHNASAYNSNLSLSSCTLEHWGMSFKVTLLCSLSLQDWRLLACSLLQSGLPRAESVSNNDFSEEEKIHFEEQTLDKAWALVGTGLALRIKNCSHVLPIVRLIFRFTSLSNRKYQ